MQKSQEKLDHAKHNEEVCEYLTLKDGYTDWVITTAFYSSLQFVTYHIFPFTHNSGGKSRTFHTLDQYHSFVNDQNSSSSIKKHTLLVEIAEDKCVEIADQYKRLLDLSYNARYVNYQHPKEVGVLAKSLMSKIKKHCTMPAPQLKKPK